MDTRLSKEWIKNNLEIDIDNAEQFKCFLFAQCLNNMGWALCSERRCTEEEFENVTAIFYSAMDLIGLSIDEIAQCANRMNALTKEQRSEMISTAANEGS